MALYRKSLPIPENVREGMREALKKSSGEPRGREIFSSDSKSRSNRAKTETFNGTKLKTFMWGKKTPKSDTVGKSICH